MRVQSDTRMSDKANDDRERIALKTVSYTHLITAENNNKIYLFVV